MRLLSGDGASVVLSPTGYEFGRGDAPRGDWDANWLLMHGEVRTASAESWSFHLPCLTTWDAAQLLVWLRAASQGRVAPTDTPVEDSEGLLAFTEPNLGFSVASIDEHDVVLRVHLLLDSAPGRPDNETGLWDLYANSVPLAMTRAALVDAADQWHVDIAPYPER